VDTSWLVELATSGANTLVGAAATTGWNTVRDGFVQLFAKDDAARRKVIEARLDAVPGGDEREVGTWTIRLTDLLQEQPQLADELRALITLAAQSGGPASPVYTQSNTARDDATQYNVQGGTMRIHHHGSVPETEANKVRPRPNFGPTAE